MIVYFADRDMTIVGHASTALPQGLRIQKDKLVDEVGAGVVSFEFDLVYDRSGRANAERWTAAGNYIFRQVDGDARLFTIIDTEQDVRDGIINVYAEDAGLDLLGEVCEAYTATSAMGIADYIRMFTAGSGFTVGINELRGQLRTLEWSGESTATERLLSVATEFGAELTYSFVITGMAVTAQHVNVYKKRGKSAGAVLRLGRDIDDIRVKRSVANLATALKATGTNITLKGETYDDGDFYVDSVTGILMSRTALSEWKRKLASGDGHITKTYSYQTTSKTELLNRAIAQLTQLCEVDVEYEVDLVKLPGNCVCGDTVRIADSEGGLYLSARIMKLEDSEADGTHKATLGEYAVLNTGV